MTNNVLHHYDISPFGELARLALALKGLEWQSVMAVLIQTEQSGDDPVAGKLLQCDWRGIVIRRESKRAGPVNVHFPRLGQIVIPA